MPGLEISRYNAGHGLVNHIAIEKAECRLLRKLPTDTVDYESIQELLAFCEKHHGSSCGYQSRRSNLSYLKVIDCSSRELVPIADRKFVALSYVWGIQNDQGSHMEWSSVLNDPLPNTIENAMFVAARLEIGYLWVDRYCIDQSNDDDVRRHIANMAQIYERATMTIIDCVGANPYYGLAGVSTTSPRRQLKEVSLSGFRFLEVGNGPYFNLENSPWWQRGWTFQEGLLSRRRLCFTSEMVYFECNSMAWSEIISKIPIFPQNPNQPRTEDQFNPLFPTGSHSCPVVASSLISDYRNRVLTNPVDILDAILGGLDAFESNGSGFRHIWGLPIFSSMGLCNTRHPLDKLLVDIPPNMWSSDLAISLALAWRPR